LLRGLSRRGGDYDALRRLRKCHISGMHPFFDGIKKTQYFNLPMSD
jgi:hypothetical protein